MKRIASLLFLAIFFSTIKLIAQTSFWEPTNDPPNGLGKYVFALTIDSDDVIFAGTTDGVFRSQDNGETWIQRINGLAASSVRSLAINSSGDVFAGTDGGGVFRSTNNGDTWIQINNGITATNISSIAINSTGDIFAGAIDGGIFRSTDNGNTWVEINASNGLTDSQVTSIAINSNDDIFAATFQSRVFRSTNNGDTWQERIYEFSGNGSSFAMTITSIGNIFLGTYDGTYRSSDNGDNWVQVSSAVRDVMALISTSSSVIFASRSGFGAYQSTDNGDTWLQINEGLTILFVNAYALNSNRILFAGTPDGFFRSVESVESVTSVNESSQIPSSFSLKQNYPNPFNTSTQISYSIYKSDFVTLKIYDLHGGEIQTLVDEFQKAGKYHFMFNVSNLSGGVYLYKLLLGSNFVETKRMILIR